TEMTYTVGGNRTIVLRVTDGDGATNATQAEVRVVEPVVANFTVSPSSPSVNVTVEMNASPSRGLTVEHEWDVDDDGEFNQTGKSVNVVYRSPGDYDVTLLVRGRFGSIDTVTRTLTVEGTQVTDEEGTGVLAVFVFLLAALASLYVVYRQYMQR
ncbi:MAG: PKD domain-containing protein, partial [Halobacteria archaeon]|nr:PKD domain-containing protein [Halobacteria archaeon]